MEKIVAVVVTFNRIDLVKRTISSLRSQTRKLDGIIVIDNDCTDGTAKWLDSQDSLTVIHQENTGGSGGFWRGIKEAYERGYDWIWCMDDDVFPKEDCLELLLKHRHDSIGILCPHRIMNGTSFLTESRVINLTNPFKNTYDFPLKSSDIENKNIIDIQGMSFEGPLIKRDVVTKIGFPNKDLFILYDDTDYSYRTILSGYRVVFVKNAIMEKYHFISSNSKVQILLANKWKIPYHIRNSAYFCHKYGKNVFVRGCGAMPFVIKMYFAILFNFIKGHKYKLSDVVLYTKMVAKGKRHELGKI